MQARPMKKSYSAGLGMLANRWTCRDRGDHARHARPDGQLAAIAGGVPVTLQTDRRSSVIASPGGVQVGRKAVKWLHWHLPIIALAFALPASAQSVDPSAQQGVERIVATYAEHLNKQDAAGLADLFTKDGVFVSQSPAGAVKSGPQAIVQYYQGMFKNGVDHVDITLSQVEPLGSDVAIGWGEYQVAGQRQSGPIKFGGDWTATYVRDAGMWKIRLLSLIPKPPAPASQ
jgi:uncharacterized protein (TIGR02246 family)